MYIVCYYVFLYTYLQYEVPWFEPHLVGHAAPVHAVQVLQGGEVRGRGEVQGGARRILGCKQNKGTC